MKIVKYTRTPFEVDAVQVTAENMAEVAEWCKGELVDNGAEDKHIKVEVERVLNDRQTMAFVTDWVLFAGKGYKVYTEKAFKKSFKPVQTPKIAVSA
jgi:hypothetical protein